MVQLVPHDMGAQKHRLICVDGYKWDGYGTRNKGSRVILLLLTMDVSIMEWIRKHGYLSTQTPVVPGHQGPGPGMCFGLTERVGRYVDVINPFLRDGEDDGERYLWENTLLEVAVLV